MNQPLVSVIVPTYNSEAYLFKCLHSIVSQTYKNIELIVIDRQSTDLTVEIANKFTTHVIDFGDERSMQRNYGASLAKGDFIVFIDSDMYLDKDVILECVDACSQDGVAGVIIPEESIGQGFWAECKRLERSFYVGVDWIEAARFFPKRLFDEVGGYNQELISGEDWDLSQKIKQKGTLARITAFISHDEGRLSLIKTLKKKYYYAQKISKYLKSNQDKSEVKSQTSIIDRYRLFFSNPGKLFAKPCIGLAMLFMKTMEFGVGAVGLIRSRIDVSRYCYGLRLLWLAFISLKLQSVLLFIASYLKNRNGAKTTLELKNGIRVEARNHTSDMGETVNILSGKEYNEIDRYSKILNHPLIIIDAGANIGLFTLFIAHKYTLITSYLIEPDAENVNQLRTNLELNHLTDRVHIFENALYMQTKKVSFNSNADHYSKHVIYDDESNTSTVDGISFVDFDSQCALESIDILKLDIEGSEWDLLTPENYAVFNKAALIIIEYHLDKNPRKLEISDISNYFEKDYEIYHQKKDERIGLIYAKRR
ncbi:FkbM family methyltransferase [candidate division WWE3 bacterium]|nr:FkbM family methyltransferase [candidate division WWE3 bacterium]